jgi:hypothetical protein
MGASSDEEWLALGRTPRHTSHQLPYILGAVAIILAFVHPRHYGA